MKCTARLIYYKKLTKAGKKRLFTSIPYNMDLSEWGKNLPDATWQRLDFTESPIKVCGGKIIAEIGCHAEPTYGEEYDTYPEMEINFICEDCKQYYHPNLPRGVEELNVWLTEIIEQRD